VPKIFKHIFKIKLLTAQKFVGVLILFSIALQIFAPLRAIADHHIQHSGGNIGILTREQFDYLLYTEKNKQGELIQEPNLSRRLSNLRVSPLDDFKNSYKNITGQTLNLTNEQIKQLEPERQTEITRRGEEDGCSGNFSGWTISCLVTRGIAWVGYRILQLVSWLLFISAHIFDLSAQLSLDYRAYSAKTATPVYLGWRAARDFVNILFIFIILIIALALILQVQQYYSKQVLVKLVGVALFINFSFFLCQQIINFTNSAAIYFKDRVTGCSDETCSKNWNLSKIFVDELNPQTMLNNYTVEVQIPASDAATKAQYTELNKTMKETNPGAIAMIIATFGGIIIILTASFVLLAAAGMFLLRLVMLWNLIILAPIAIMASILPITQQHFRSWWSRFTREAFFAPSMMFMFYIEMSILKQGFLRDFVANNAPSGTKVFGSPGATFTFNFYLIAIYILMMMLFIKALFVARSMSATGADAIWRGGKKAMKWGTGQYGKKPLYATGRGIRSFARSRVAPAAERITTGEGRIGKAFGGTIGKITGIRAGARQIIKNERAATEAKTKKWEGLTNDEKAKELSLMKTSKYTDRLREGDMSGASIANVVALIQSLQKTGGLGKVNKETLKDAHSYLKSRGVDTKELETYMPSLAKDETGREKAIQRQRQQADKTSEYLQIANEFDYAKNPKNRDLHLKNWDEGNLKEMYKSVSAADPGDTKILPQAKNLLQGYVDKYGTSMDNIVSGLEKDNNNSAARFLKTAEGERMFQTMVKKTGIETPRVLAAKTAGTEIEKPLTPGTYATKAQAKEDLQLEDRELVNDVILNKNGELNKTEEGKEKTFAIVQQADNKRLSDILTGLQTLSATEKKEFLAIVTNKDKDTAQRIVNINPTIIRNADQNTKDSLGLQTIQDVVDKMPSKNAQYMTHDALMDEEVIKALSKPQLMNLAEFNIPTKEERNKIINTLKTPIITITGAREPAVSDEIKNYMEGNPYWGNRPNNRRTPIIGV